MSACIYLEGGGDSTHDRSRCRAGFRRLLEKCGFVGRMPRLVASGGRNSVYDDFKTAHDGGVGTDYVALLIDSEDPVPNIDETWDETWDYLENRDSWERPPGTRNDQVLLMTTCMETWIASDRNALRDHFGPGFHDAALPALQNIENRSRKDVLQSLQHATRDCPGPYAKGPKSFEVPGKLDPDGIAPTSPLSNGRAGYSERSYEQREDGVQKEAVVSGWLSRPWTRPGKHAQTKIVRSIRVISR